MKKIVQTFKEMYSKFKTIVSKHHKKVKEYIDSKPKLKKIYEFLKRVLFYFANLINSNYKIVILFGLSIFVSLYLYGIVKTEYESNILDFRYELLTEIIKTLIISVIIGFFTKIITDEFIRIQKNDFKMKNIGINKIGDNKLDFKQANIMFGNEKLGCRNPKELKFLFISGIVFIDDYKERIIETILNGCNVKILLADPKKSKDFLERAEVLRRNREGKREYIKELPVTAEIIDYIAKEVKVRGKGKDNVGSIELRHYRDEYRYNIRVAQYEIKENEFKYISWANFQPMVEDSVNLSLAVIGEAKSKDADSKTDEGNMVLAMNEAFDILWETYKKK